MSEPHDLIDRHLAGVLTSEEEARLEELIRTSPDWRERYREAERMAELMREGLGGSRAPAARKRAIRQELAAARSPRRLERPRPARGLSRRQWLVAACALVTLGAGYLFLGTDEDSSFIQPVYADAPMPLLDLARSSDVLLLGTVVAEGGALRLRLQETVYGDASGRALSLPPGLVAGQEIALFGRYRGDDMIAAVAGPRGVVHLDGVQAWEGARHDPDAVRARVEGAPALRTRDAAMADLEAFLDSAGTREGRQASGDLTFSAEVTARFLGRFDVETIRPLLVRLIRAQEKHPEARNAGAAALVAADPLASCKMLLTAILRQEVEHLHAETENGYVILRCLQLMQRQGQADLEEDLARFLARVQCPILKRASQAAWLAVRGEGAREPGADIAPTPMRIEADGREATVIPGCGDRAQGTIVLFRPAGGVAQLATTVEAAIQAQRCVLILPEGEVDALGWLQRARAEAPGRLVEGPVTYLGIGRGAERALQAAETQAPGAVVLVGGEKALAAGAAALSERGVRVETHEVPDLADALPDRGLWTRVLTSD